MIKPLLAVNVDLDKLIYPVYVSPKYDGIRTIIKDNCLFSRNGKPIPNKHTQSLFKDYNGFDGELIVGDVTDTNVFQITTSGVMSVEGTPDVYLYIFDKWDAEGGIVSRYEDLKKCYDYENSYNTILVPQTLVNNEKELLDAETFILSLGYEGIIIRNPDAKYKYGRSTLKESALLKLKRFSDSEAEILGVEPLLRNHNEKIINILGYSERSNHKDNKVVDNLLGTLIVKDSKTGIEFNVGSGFTEEQRIQLWNIKEDLIGSVIKYKYFAIGIKDKPRFPIFCGLRHFNDIS